MTPHAEGARHCATCKVLRGAHDFHQGERSRCKECARQRVAAWRAQRRGFDPPRRARATSRGFVRTQDLRALIADRIGADDISARRLAEMARIDRHTAADILAQRRSVTSVRVGDRICTALGVHIDMLDAVNRCGRTQG